MSFFVSQAYAQGQGAAPAPEASFFPMFILIAAFGTMLFVSWRSKRKYEKSQQDMIDGLSKGDEVVMKSGILGKIIDVGDVYMTLDVGSDVQLKFQKGMVHAILPKGTIKAI